LCHGRGGAGGKYGKGHSVKEKSFLHAGLLVLKVWEETNDGKEKAGRKG
jgi:hypothetical protein